MGLVGHAKERKRDRTSGTPASKHDLLAVSSDRDVGALVGNGRATAADGRSGVGGLRIAGGGRWGRGAARTRAERARWTQWKRANPSALGDRGGRGARLAMAVTAVLVTVPTLGSVIVLRGEVQAGVEVLVRGGHVDAILVVGVAVNAHTNAILGVGGRVRGVVVGVRVRALFDGHVSGRVQAGQSQLARLGRSNSAALKRLGVFPVHGGPRLSAFQSFDEGVGRFTTRAQKVWGGWGWWGWWSG